MNEYCIEVFIESDEDENVKSLNLNEENKQEWKEEMEARALSEYYKRKIRTSRKNNKR